MNFIPNPPAKLPPPRQNMRLSKLTFLLLLLGFSALLSIVVVQASLGPASGDIKEPQDAPEQFAGIVTATPPSAPQKPVLDDPEADKPVDLPVVPMPEVPNFDDGEPLSSTINILILGSDRRPGEPNWRTDVIILLAVRPETNEAAVISFPRDLYIHPIPNHYSNRINVIDYLGEQDEPGGGGPRLLKAILEERLQVPIHHFVRFDFQGFVTSIDALGGLTIHVDCPLYEYYPEENIYLNLEPGVHKLTGQQSLSYVRSRRSGGGDLERVRRQQRVVWALRRQLVDQNLLPRVPALYTALRDSIETDVSLITAVQLLHFAFSLNEENIKGLVLRPPDAMREGWRRQMFVFLADWPYIADMVQRVFERPPFMETNTTSDTDTATDTTSAAPASDTGLAPASDPVARPVCP